MKFLARFLLTPFFLLFFIFYPFASAHAQVVNNAAFLNTDPNVPTNLHTVTQSVILEVLTGLTCQLIGQDPTTTSHECLGVDPTTGKIGYVQSNGGAVGFVGSMIAALYTPPAHTATFFQYEARNFGLVKHAYAAGSGIGFTSLEPLLALWSTFRNIAYFVFIIIFIAVGFAIMFRVKIDPRTVMTIENQIPKIIVGLVLVTFSYAIAGFLIDMMYSVTYLTINVITSAESSHSDFTAQIQNTEKNDLAGGTPFAFMNDIVPGGLLGVSAGSAGSVKDIIQNLLSAPVTSGGNGTNGAIGGGLIGLGVGTAACVVVGIASAGIGFFPCAGLILASGALGAIGGGLSGQDLQTDVQNALGYMVADIASVLAFLIIAIAIIIALFRVWFSLLLAYVSILLDVVFSPFFIIAGVFPGSKIGFGAWLRDIGSNLLAFPVTVGMFLLAGVFMESFATSGNTLFVPPLIGNPGGSGQSPFAYIIALGMILLTPNVVNITKGILKAPENKYLQTIGQGVGLGVSPLTQGIKGAISYNQPSLGPSGKAGWLGVLGGLFG